MEVFVYRRKSINSLKCWGRGNEVKRVENWVTLRSYRGRGSEIKLPKIS